jgi:hypothetical protein
VIVPWLIRLRRRTGGDFSITREFAAHNGVRSSNIRKDELIYSSVRDFVNRLNSKLGFSPSVALKLSQVYDKRLFNYDRLLHHLRSHLRFHSSYNVISVFKVPSASSTILVIWSSVLLVSGYQNT